MVDSLLLTLDRIRINQELKEALADDNDASNKPGHPGMVTKPAATTPAPKDTDDSNSDNDGDDSDDDSSDDDDDSSDDDDDADATKEFPATAEIKPLCDQIEGFGDQLYVISELVKQVEGFKAQNNTDAQNSALAGLRDALSETADMQVKMKNGLVTYLKKYAPADKK